jgi:acyl-CoA synthetase (NDP forming)
MQEMKYKGKIYPINPNAEEILGLKCYPSLEAVPGVPDYVIMAVSAGRAEQALNECAAKGARNIHMFTAGFGETGEEEGAKLAERLRAVARRGRLNIIGPNCMGIYSPRARISPWGNLPTEVGPIAFLTQSGALGGEFSRLAMDSGLRMSLVVSFGNGYVLDSTDYLEYLERDKDTKYIAMYLEGVQDGQKLVQMVRRIMPKKPVIICKGGSTGAGAKAAASHTGALAGDQEIWDAFFAQTGAVRVDSIEELIEVLVALQHYPPCTGRGVGFMGGAGGTSVTGTDVCARAGLEVPDISESTQKELRSFIGVAGTSVRNPMDVGMQLRRPEDHLRVMELVAADPKIDIMLMITHPAWGRWGGRRGGRDMQKGLIKFAQTLNKKMPFCVAIRNVSDNLDGEKARLKMTEEYVEAGIPVFKSVERACKTLYKLTGYYRAVEALRADKPVAGKARRRSRKKTAVRKATTQTVRRTR